MATVIHKKYLLLVFVSASLLQSSCAQNECPADLQLSNTVVYEGNTTFIPRVSNGDAVKWQVLPGSDSYNTLNDITNYDDVVVSQFASTYAVNQSGLSFNATTAPQGNSTYATAGVYILNYQTADCSTGAGLVVIKSGPVCSIDLSNPNQPALTCSVEFANYIQQQINPIMTWSNGSGVVRTDTPDRASLDLNNPGLQSATSSLPISPNDANTYQCNLTFSAPSPAQPSFLATNVPTFSATCVVSNYLLTTTAVPSTTQQPTTTTPPLPTTTTLSSVASPTSSSVASSPPSTASSTPTTISSSAPSTISSTISTSSSSAPLLTSPSVSTPQTPPLTSPTTPSTSRPTIAATPVYDGQSQALAILLSLLFGTLFATAAICFCWCCCCFYYPFGDKDEKRRQRRRLTRIHRIIFFRSYPTPEEELNF